MNLIILTLCLSSFYAQAEYSKVETRETLLEKELQMSIGRHIVLNDNERTLNDILMKWKQEEVSDPNRFKLTQSFFEFREVMGDSKVYQFIKEMPKGAALHVHINAVLGPDFFLQMTHSDHMHICQDNKTKLTFSHNKPEESCENQWELISDVRKNLSLANLTEFNADLKSKFTLIGTDFSDVSTVWNHFAFIFDIIYPLWTYRPVWEEYMYAMLEEFRKDHVMYVEVRSSVPELYELDGTKHDDVYFINMTKRIVEDYASTHPDFLGMKMIISLHRSQLPNKVEEVLEQTKKLKRMFPDFIAGFDLVGYEDGGASLLEFLPQLTAAKQELSYFFHAGETKWFGAPSDENLFDAIELGAKRIGHAFALDKHPMLLDKVKEKDIGLEINVISNNVLNYVHDLRNHPVSSYIARGLPVVVSSDDPGLWGAPPLTADLFAAFAAAASRRHDLRLLKQLALNSIRYSALKESEKEAALNMFHGQWDKFLETMTKQHVQVSYFIVIMSVGCAIGVILFLLLLLAFAHFQLHYVILFYYKSRRRRGVNIENDSDYIPLITMG